MNLVLLGPPGAGKGTQGALLADRKNLARLSTGDLLRRAVRDHTELGRRAQGFMEAGELVPDEVILGLVREFLETTEPGVIFDGFPRTLVQAEALEAILDEVRRSLHAVVVLEVSDDVLVQRISGRRSCPDCGQVYNVYLDPPATDDICDACGAALVQRPDDQEDTVRRRLQVYRARTEPLIAFYEAGDVPVLTVQGEGDADVIGAAIDRALELTPA